MAEPDQQLAAEAIGRFLDALADDKDLLYDYVEHRAQAIEDWFSKLEAKDAERLGPGIPLAKELLTEGNLRKVREMVRDLAGDAARWVAGAERWVAGPISLWVA